MTSAARSLLTLLTVATLFVTGCGSASTETTSSSITGEASSPTRDGQELDGSITVSAAASLRDVLTEIGEDFSSANPGVEVIFNFDSSSTLSTQILEGAAADVYASADEANMAKLADERLISGDPVIFARNELVMVTKPGNPKGITRVADLANAGVISLCGDDVPCGRYAKEALEIAGITIPEANVSRGQNVTATLTAVSQGDAVAGIVYVTDAESAGDAVDTVDIPTEDNVIATYPIGVLHASSNPEAATAFKGYVLSDDGQAVLEQHGFLPPT